MASRQPSVITAASMSYGTTRGNAEFMRKLNEIATKYCFSNDTATVRYCVSKVFEMEFPMKND